MRPSARCTAQGNRRQPGPAWPEGRISAFSGALIGARKPRERVPGAGRSVGIAAQCIDDDELGLGALLLHQIQYRFNAEPVHPLVAQSNPFQIVASTGIVSLVAADLDAKAAEKQHNHGIRPDLGFSDDQSRGACHPCLRLPPHPTSKPSRRGVAVSARALLSG